MTAKILYVEDDGYNARLVRKILEIHDFQVIEASDGLNCLTIAAYERPDLILMDVNLPGIDGLEATARLKAIPELAPIPVIAVTAQANGNRDYFLAAGCDDYLPKPFSRSDLLNIVQRYLPTDEA